MAKGLNNAWQYCCTKIKEKCWKYMDNHGRLLLPLDVILKCKTCQINPNSKPELEVWYWYVNDLLPVAALDPDAWCVEFWGFQLLSKAKPKKAGKGVCITTSMEAFATTVLKGCHKPWQDWYVEEHKPKNLGKTFEYVDFDKYNAAKGKDPKDTPHKKPWWVDQQGIGGICKTPAVGHSRVQNYPL
jgi:hypothetical protein